MEGQRKAFPAVCESRREGKQGKKGSKGESIGLVVTGPRWKGREHRGSVGE